MPLPTMTPHERRERAIQKRTCLRKFIVEEQFTTTRIAQALLGVGESATRSALMAEVRDGIIEQRVVETDLGALSVWAITPHGWMVGSEIDGEFDLPEIGRIAATTIFHGLEVQKVRIVALRAGFQDWKSSSYCQRRAARERKNWLNIPDATAFDSCGAHVAIEVERRFKSPRRYSDIFAKYLRMIKLGMIDHVAYVTPTAGMAMRLKSQFDRIIHVVFAGQRILVTDQHRSRLQVYAFDSWPHAPISDTQRTAS